MSRCLFLDLETRGDDIFRIGAIRGEKTFERKGRFDPAKAILDLDGFARGAEIVVGHNVLEHDLPILQRTAPGLGLLAMPVIDTLFLSPIAFPENPYHRLVKEYKLVTQSVNDPLADARLAAVLFQDQWERLAKASESALASLYRYCLEHPAFPCAGFKQGFSTLFDAIGTAPLAPQEFGRALAEILASTCCRTALAEISEEAAVGALDPAPIVYCIAWLGVAGSNSVLPPWVWHRFPQVPGLLLGLRDQPCKDPECAWCRETHDPTLQLNRWFSFPGFMSSPVGKDGGSLQEDIIRTAMADRPLLAIMPTGGGKSLCYQLPGLLRHFRRGQLTVVLSPLQALMKDQVDALEARTGASSAAALYGLLTPPERGEVLNRVRLGDVALLYVAPEQLRNRSFHSALAQREIGCWVFDEAHCLSKWGHDFRPDYLYAGRFIREFAARQKVPPPPVACFTATAKQDVKLEITDFFRRELGQELDIFESVVERSNLSFEVQTVNHARKLGRACEVLTERLPPEGGCALVYTATRAGAEEAAEFLRSQGWNAAAFHGGLEVPRKREVLEGFMKGDLRVVCATNAFGMGIDRNDVRLVLHLDIPGSLENYIQEAGRAGRDRQDAECVLLYDEQDIETQFRLGAMSELSRREIAGILRALRRARRTNSGEVVITPGELLRYGGEDFGLSGSHRGADTRVKTAVAWLERAGFVARDQNDTRVFQGRPLVRDLAKARELMTELRLPAGRRVQWLAILEALMNAPAGKALNADELAELPALKDPAQEREPAFRPQRSESQRVIRTLHDMAEAGLVQKGILLSAFVRHKVKDNSQSRLKRACLLDIAMLRVMHEAAPDAETGSWQDLSLRRLNQRLRDNGFADSTPQVLLRLLRSLSMDGKGLAGARGSLTLRHSYQDSYRVKLLRGWDALLRTAELRRAVAHLALGTILSRIPLQTLPSADLLVEFSSEEIAHAFRSDLFLGGRIRDSLAAVDRGLMFLHEQKAIILQHGLAVFRQAMTIRLLPVSAKRRYSKSDFEPLLLHYDERTLQVHVMDEYARLGVRKVRQALELVLAYFRLDKTSFIRRFFPGRKEMLRRATGRESYERIVESLGDPAQTAVVTANPGKNMLVLAGPGSGKTRTVVHRCAYLLRVERVPARSILVLCFNRLAAADLRRRLADLVKGDDRGVTVRTYHSLAMALTGMSFAERAERGSAETPDFDKPIEEAVRLLRGETDLPGLEPDELRDRLLSGCSHILVDEYQDIDEKQYALISSLAGRTEKDPDSKLAIMAVGDDDQNIYSSFRNTNVEFIRRFQKDYGASIHCLDENYRSSAHIVSAANRFIRRNRDRMKTGEPLRVNASREADPPGGPWESRDPLARGRVQVLETASATGQALALLAELGRFRRLDPSARWSDFAVLARVRKELFPIRALLDHHEIPVSWGLDGTMMPPLHRIREIARFLDELKQLRGEAASASEIEDRLWPTLERQGGNPWQALLAGLLSTWAHETKDVRMPVQDCVEFLYESLAEQKREHRMGDGVFLSTVHSAKGMEFRHVFIPDGGWRPSPDAGGIEEERRVFYVGMSRAKETLCLFERKDRGNPHVRLLEGDYVLHRPGDETVKAPAETQNRGYALLGMKDIKLSYAGRRVPGHPIHRTLASLGPGSVLRAAERGGRIELLDKSGAVAAVLSDAARRAWLPRLGDIRSVRVLALIRMRKKESEDEYRQAIATEQWEVPWVEVCFRVATNFQG